MSNRETGFYRAWKDLPPWDFSGRLLGIQRFGRTIRDLPAESEDAIALGLTRLGIPESRWTDYLSRQLAQLPGWAGLFRWLGKTLSITLNRNTH